MLKKRVLLLPLDVQQGKIKAFVFSFLLLPAMCPAKTRSPSPPHDGKPGSRALLATPIGQLTRCRGRAVKPCSLCAAIGAAPLPLPYKYHPTPAQKGDEKGREDGENRKRGNKIERGRKEYGEA